MISIIIVNYNGLKWNKKCISSLLTQTYSDFEIIFVDNNSTDESIQAIENTLQDSRIHIIQSDKNLGFAGGNNLGLKYCSGEYILLLNNDTWVEKDFLEILIKSFDELPNLGTVQPKIVLMNDESNLDACGAFWTNSTFLYHIGIWKNKNLKIYNTPFSVFSVKGASMMIKKEVIEKVGLFDEDFWCYYEETDLCQRIWMAGYECWYYPKTTCYHAMGGTAITFNKSYIEFHNFKNKLLCFLKNFEIKSLIVIIPLFIIISIGISIIRLLTGNTQNFFSIYKSYWWNIINIKSTIKKRRLIQGFRIKTDKEILKGTKKNPRLIYYYYLLINPGKLKKYEDKF